MPAFTVDPAWCDIQYSYSVSPIEAEAAIYFEPLTRTFTFHNVDDLGLSGPDYSSYMVFVKGLSGAV